MTQEHGDPNDYPESFALADDGSPPQAAEVNVGLSALADRTAWLRRHVNLATESITGGNYIPCEWSGAERHTGAGVTRLDPTTVLAVGAGPDRFVAVCADSVGSAAALMHSRDGIAWSAFDAFDESMHTWKLSGSGGRLVGALGINENNAAVFAGASNDPSPASSGYGGGRHIMVQLLDSNVPTFVTATGVAVATNYSAVAFAGDSAYLFGGNGCVANVEGGDFTTTAISGYVPRVVRVPLSGPSAYVANNAVGGAIVDATIISNARQWRAASNGLRIVAVPVRLDDAVLPRTDRYITVDAATGAVTVRSFPEAVRFSDVVYWRGAWWASCPDGADDPGLFRSADGVLWERMTTRSTTSRILLSGTQMLLTGPDGSFVWSSRDGLQWQQVPVSLRLTRQSVGANTAQRSLIVERPGVPFADRRGNARVSLGGLL